MHKLIKLNNTYCTDNLELMKRIPNNHINLIYCDILYGTGKDFGDYKDLKPNKKEIEDFYIPRIREMYRILKDDGAIYLQMDFRINHWIRCIMDDIFGYDNFQNEIIWLYNGGGVTKKRFNRKHDTIYFYGKQKDTKFNVQYQPYKENSANRLSHSHRNKKSEDEINRGTPMVDWWQDIKAIVNPDNNEYVPYKTQKPKELLERIIKASSNENDVVADFFCGSGTTLVVAKELGRQYIGCDINPKAIEITNNRLL